LFGPAIPASVSLVFIVWFLLSFPYLWQRGVRALGVDVWLWALGGVRAMFRSLRL
jgi:hypothetical protein